MDSLISEKGWYGNHSIRIRKKNWVFPRRDFEEEATTLVISSDGSLRMRFIAWDDSQRGRFIINGGRLTPKVFELVVGQPF